MANWLCLHHRRTGVGRCRVLMQKWGYNQNSPIDCDCGEAPQTMKHLLKGEGSRLLCQSLCFAVAGKSVATQKKKKKNISEDPKVLLEPKLTLL